MKLWRCRKNLLLQKCLMMIGLYSRLLTGLDFKPNKRAGTTWKVPISCTPLYGE